MRMKLQATASAHIKAFSLVQCGKGALVIQQQTCNTHGCETYKHLGLILL